MPSRRMGNRTSHDPTMFWILNSRNLAEKPSFWMIRAYFLAASRDASSLLAPVHTILPDAKMRAVVLGSRILMITAANLLGLYSAFRACRAISFRSNLHPKLTVETRFLKAERGGVVRQNQTDREKFVKCCGAYWRVGTIPDGCLVRSTSLGRGGGRGEVGSPPPPLGWYCCMSEDREPVVSAIPNCERKHAFRSNQLFLYSARGLH